MFMIARLYPSDGPARAAVKAIIEAGYEEDSVVMLSAPDAPAVASADGDAEDAAVEASSIDVATAVRAGRMLGEQADFYLSRLTDGKALVVTTPPFIASRRAEEILDAHDPLPDSHLPPKEPFVPLSERPTPFSYLLGLPVTTKSETPFSDLLGFGFKEEGLSHLSRWFPPLASDFTFSSRLGMGFRASKDTFFGMPTRSDRLEGKTSSFGMGFKASTATPFSSLLGLPLLTMRKHFLTAEYQD
jgi:hypothetical protein